MDNYNKVNNDIELYENCPACSFEKEIHLKNAKDYLTGETFDIKKETICGVFYKADVKNIKRKANLANFVHFSA